MNFLKTLASHYKGRDPWRRKAWDMFLAKGLPTHKWEAFRHVPLKALYETTFSPLEQGEAAAIQGGRGSCTFVNGVFRNELSQLDGVICLPLTQAIHSYGLLLQKNWSHVLVEETNPFHLLNHALFEEGLFLYVAPRVHTSVEWTFLSTKSKQMHTPRVEIFLGQEASLTISSHVRGEGQYWHNESLSISLDKGANLLLEERFSHSRDAWGFHTKRVRLKEGAKFRCNTLSKGAKAERHDIEVILAGEDSEVDLKGLSLIAREAEIHHHLFVRHEKPHTLSNQHYKTVLQDSACSSFEGKIYVAKIAQKTKAYQLNNNLLLSPKARARSKPNLEIMADDVQATHGATSTQPRADEMFYFMSRGVDKKKAKRHLVKGFCRELFSEEVVDANF